MTDQQEFDSLIAGLPTKADRLFHWKSPEERKHWVEHVTEKANYLRNQWGIEKALEYLRA